MRSLLLLALFCWGGQALAQAEATDGSAAADISATEKPSPKKKPDRFVAVATKEAIVYRRQDGKFLPTGKIQAGEKVLILNEYKDGKILAVGNKRIKGFVKGPLFEKKFNYDEARRRKGGKEFNTALKEVWDDNTEAEDLLVNHSALRWGLGAAYNKDLGLGFGAPLFYGFAHEYHRIELGGDLYYFAFNAGHPLELDGFFRYIFCYSWFEFGPEAFVSVDQLLALDNTRGYNYGPGAVMSFRFTNGFQFTMGLRVGLNKHVVPSYNAGFIFTL